MFKRPSIRYGKTPQAETPYQRAAQVWDERIGSARVQARSWRYAFFGALALSAILTGSLVWQNARGTIVPWVVEVNKRRARQCRIRPKRSADCVSSCPVYRKRARHSRRSDRGARELDVSL